MCLFSVQSLVKPISIQNFDTTKLRENVENSLTQMCNNDGCASTRVCCQGRMIGPLSSKSEMTSRRCRERERERGAGALSYHRYKRRGRWQGVGAPLLPLLSPNPIEVASRSRYPLLPKPLYTSIWSCLHSEVLSAAVQASEADSDFRMGSNLNADSNIRVVPTARKLYACSKSKAQASINTNYVRTWFSGDLAHGSLLKTRPCLVVENYLQFSISSLFNSFCFQWESLENLRTLFNCHTRTQFSSF